jgi:hypothetical protein
VARRGRKPVNVTGKPFGQLTVLAEVPGTKGRRRSCKVRCACGSVCTKEKKQVTSGQVKTCGRRCPLAWAEKSAKADARALTFLARREAGESTAAIARSLGWTREGVNRLVRRAARAVRPGTPRRLAAGGRRASAHCTAFDGPATFIKSRRAV